MGKHKKWRLFLVAVWLISFSSLWGQEFSDFFVDFLRYPENQTKYIQFPIKADNATIRNSASYNPITLSARNNIPVLCSDSLNAIMNLPFSVVSIVNFNKETTNNCVFEQRDKGWRLMSYKHENIKDQPNVEFLNFLIQYSKDESFQMKHTIFPFFYRIYKTPARNNPETKLLMPREWIKLDFISTFPSLCIFNSNDQAPNRQLFVFKGAKMAQFFNFILINKKWYLIEIEEYK